MIENNYIELGKRAVACEGWRWMPGMRWRTEDDRGRLDDYQPEYMGRPLDALPDLTDPATLGCLLALVREAWEQDDMGACRYREYWCAEVTPQEGQRHAFYGASEAEALVLALESAP
jgi:hypothetical protein